MKTTAQFLAEQVIDCGPMHEEGCGNVSCFFCGESESNLRPDPRLNRGWETRVNHRSDCLWVLAHAILGHPLPNRHFKDVR